GPGAPGGRAAPPARRPLRSPDPHGSTETPRPHPAGCLTSAGEAGFDFLPNLDILLSLIVRDILHEDEALGDDRIAHHLPVERVRRQRSVGLHVRRWRSPGL